MSALGKDRPLHPVHVAPDPPATGWTREDSGPDLNPNDVLLRKEAELRADRDLKKPIEQMLSDVYERYTIWNAKAESTEMPEETKTSMEFLVFAMALMTSMNARVAIENRNATGWMLKLTRTIARFTVLLVILTVALLVLTVALLAK